MYNERSVERKRTTFFRSYISQAGGCSTRIKNNFEIVASARSDVYTHNGHEQLQHRLHRLHCTPSVPGRWFHAKLWAVFLMLCSLEIAIWMWPARLCVAVYEQQYIWVKRQRFVIKNETYIILVYCDDECTFRYEIGRMLEAMDDILWLVYAYLEFHATMLVAIRINSKDSMLKPMHRVFGFQIAQLRVFLPTHITDCAS